MKIFLSYSFKNDTALIRHVHYYLNKQKGIDCFFYDYEKKTDDFVEQIGKFISRADAFVLFLGAQLGETQAKEATTAFANKIRHLVVVMLPGVSKVPRSLLLAVGAADPIRLSGLSPSDAISTSKEILKRLGRPFAFITDDGLPDGYPFEYEKKIVEEFVAGGGKLSWKRFSEGCPREWPQVPRDPADKQNPVPKEIIGDRRLESAAVMADARVGWREKPSGNEDAIIRQLTFPEAGPREHVRYPIVGASSLTVGVLVSGGIAPGINAVVDGIVSRHNLYRQKGGNYQLTMLGYTAGFKSLLYQAGNRILLDAERVKRQAERGGSLLATSRAEELMDEDPSVRMKHLQTIVERLAFDNVDILYVIGGDGSMRAAHAVWKVARDSGKKISVIGVPKTTDNDILWVWQSFGFLSAAEKAREVVLNLHTEVTSNPRLCIIQLFGSDSGFVVSHAALASGVCDAVLIPEVPFSMRGLSDYIQRILRARYVQSEGKNPAAIIVLAETAIPTDARKYHRYLIKAEKEAVEKFFRDKHQIRGQTPDPLRTAGLKIVSKALEEAIRQIPENNDYWRRFRVFANEPRHLLRSIPPSVSDVTFGERLGILAVDGAIAGYTDFMVSQWLTEFVFVPLELVVLGRKRVPQRGIFWKSVLATTGQPAEM